MALSINNNTMALTAYRNLSVNQGDMARAMERLSSGYRINSARDDASGLVVSEGLRGQLAGLKTATRNAQDAQAMLQIAEGTLGAVHGMLQRMRDLAVQALSSSADGAAIDNEYQQLSAEISRIAAAASYGTQKLFTTTAGATTGLNAAFQVGAYSGQTIAVDLTTYAVAADDLNISATQVGGGAAQAANAATALTALDTAISTVMSQRASLGAVITRMDYTIDALQVQVENVTAAESRIRDADMAMEMTELTRTQILNEAGIAMLAQANSAPTAILRLLE